MKQKLLIVYYNFPPVKVPGAVRISNFYREARKYFTEVHALTSANRYLLQQDHSLETHCPHIKEVPAWDLRRLTLRKKQSNTPYLSGNSTDRPLIAFFRRLINSFPFNILVGDGGAYYIWRGYQAGKRLVEKQGITHVFSTFRPYSDHIVAYLLKRRFPHLVWVADFRDLHVDPVLDNVVWPAFQKRCNRWVLRRADVVSTVSEGLKASLGEVHGNVVVLRNGYALPNEPQPRSSPRSSPMTIVYTGALYDGLRDPSPLFAALRQLIDQGRLQEHAIQLIYAGKEGRLWDDLVKQYRLSGCSKNLGVLPLEKTLEWQRKAHLNLLLTWSQPETKGILTGKVYEYLATGHPILALVNGTEDAELHAIIKKGHSDNQLVHSNDEACVSVVAEYIMDVYHKIMNGTWSAEAPPKAFRWDCLMSSFHNDVLCV